MKGKVALVFEDIGDHRVKNIAEPIRIYRVRLEQRDTVAIPASEEAASCRVANAGAKLSASGELLQPVTGVVPERGFLEGRLG